MPINLSKTELEILQWTADGKSQTEIGIIRGVKETTTRNQMHKIRDKLYASTAAQCVAIAIREGLIK